MHNFGTQRQPFLGFYAEMATLLRWRTHYAQTNNFYFQYILWHRRKLSIYIIGSYIKVKYVFILQNK